MAGRVTRLGEQVEAVLARGAGRPAAAAGPGAPMARAPSAAGYGYRLDHLIVSRHLEPVACEYAHEWRERGLSDHSAIWADVQVVPQS